MSADLSLILDACSCPECHDIFVKAVDTTEDYYLCPNGHGKLVSWKELELRLADIDRNYDKRQVFAMIRARQQKLYPKQTKKPALYKTEELLYEVP